MLKDESCLPSVSVDVSEIFPFEICRCTHTDPPSPPFGVKRTALDSSFRASPPHKMSSSTRTSANESACDRKSDPGDLRFEVPVLDCTDAKFESAWHLLNVPPFARRQMKIFCKCSPHVCASLVTVLQFSRSEFRQDCRELLRTKDAERKPEKDRRKK